MLIQRRSSTSTISTRGSVGTSAASTTPRARAARRRRGLGRLGIGSEWVVEHRNHGDVQDPFYPGVMREIPVWARPPSRVYVDICLRLSGVTGWNNQATRRFPKPSEARMFTRTRLAAMVAALAALAAVPAAADAKTVAMRGVVSGSPYGASSGQMAIPVLFSKQTARNTHLKSPVGVIIVKRSQKVKLPNGGGYALPVNLRTGDRFKGNGVVGSLQQRVFYPRVVFPKAVVYFRSKELSLSELSAAVASLQKSLLDLQNQLNALRDGSIAALKDLYNQLAELRAALAALKIPAGVDLTSIQGQLDALSKKLTDLIASLPDFSQFLKIGDLTSALSGNSVITALSGQVTTLQGQVTTLTSQLATVCNAIKSATVTVPNVALPIPVTVNTGGVC